MWTFLYKLFYYSNHQHSEEERRNSGELTKKIEEYAIQTETLEKEKVELTATHLQDRTELVRQEAKLEEQEKVSFSLSFILTHFRYHNGAY